MGENWEPESDCLLLQRWHKICKPYSTAERRARTALAMALGLISDGVMSHLWIV